MDVRPVWAKEGDVVEIHWRLEGGLVEVERRECPAQEKVQIRSGDDPLPSAGSNGTGHL